MYPCPRAVAITPPECSAASVSLRRSMLPSPYDRELGLWSLAFRWPLMRSLSLQPEDSLTIPKDGFVNRLHSLRFLHECDSSYRVLTFSPVGLFPLNTSAFFGHTIVEPGRPGAFFEGDRQSSA